MAANRTPRVRRALGVTFTIAGSLHFVIPRAYESIVPPYLPKHRELVQISGVAEIVGGLAALLRAPRWFTRWWLTSLLIAVFPANVHMALHPDQVRGLRVPRWTLWARLPLQAVFVAWVRAATRSDAAS